MEKLKKVLLICFVFCLTGCDVEYNLSIDQNFMTENVNFMTENTTQNKTELEKYLRVKHQAYFDMDSSSTNNYEQKEISEDDKIGVNFYYKFKNTDLQNSSLLNYCYYKKSISKVNDEVIIYTDGKTKCMYVNGEKNFDSLTINIKTNYKVLENNADKVENNIYTWIIDESNYNNHPINMKISLKENITQKKRIFIVIILFVILIIVIIFFAIRIRKKHKASNKF